MWNSLIVHVLIGFSIFHNRAQDINGIHQDINDIPVDGKSQSDKLSKLVNNRNQMDKLYKGNRNQSETDNLFETSDSGNLTDSLIEHKTLTDNLPEVLEHHSTTDNLFETSNNSRHLTDNLHKHNNLTDKFPDLQRKVTDNLSTRHINRNIKIINGSLSRTHEFPGAICLYQRNTLLHLFSFFQYKCSGVLITRHHILTAGHCLPRSVPRFLQYTNYYIAWGGNSNSQYIDDRITRRAEISDTNFKSGEQIRTCNHWYKHPEQDSLRFIYDIGVIKCDLAFNLIRDVLEIVPIAPNFPFQEDTPLEMYGWGVVNKHNDRSIRLRKYTTYTQDITTCQNEHINITATHHICTYNRASQSYKGDSGAPALYTMPRKRCHKPGSRTQHKPGSKTKSDSRAGSRTKSDKCTRSKTRCGPLTINLDELCEAISDKSNRSTQTHNTVCLHYSCDTISSSRTNDSNNSTQAHYTVLLNDLYKINYTTNSNRPIGTAHLECHFDGTKRDRGEAPNVTKFVKGEAPNATTFVKGSSISTAQNASSLGLAPNGSSLGLPQNVSSFERHTCGNTIYHISPSQTQSPYCKNSNICFTSNTTCAKTALCCKVINQEHVIRCVRNSSLHLAAYISGTHSSLPEPNGKFSQKTNLNTINNTTETKINITETEFLQRTNFNTTISNVTKTNTEADKFAERNYVCSQNGEDGFAEDYDCSQTGESDVESYGKKVIVGITSFHLDTFVVLTNITEEYYRFVYDVINMT